ncbi:MAG: molecular chaperone TorD family protein [Actinomycetota bacterium]|nr:molecular chaperone TorD family protein [Actinomycetota bacterium]
MTLAGVLPGRWELVRAVGALSVVNPPAGDHIAASLGIPPLGTAEHTDLFVLSLPPYAGIHLGGEGKLGGEGADRVAGLWRALSLDPPADADHLGSLLLLYAELGEAADGSSSEPTRQRLGHSRAVLLWEHLWSWVPGYLDAATGQATPGPAGAVPAAVRAWADLTRRLLVREAMLTPGATTLPLALRAAPSPLDAAATAPAVLDAVTAPVRTGFVLTYRDLDVAARRLGLGLRRGERRFALQAMLDQDPAATLAWLGDHARRWARLHRRRPAVAHDPGIWWAERATASAEVLTRQSGLNRALRGKNSPGSHAGLETPDASPQ